MLKDVIIGSLFGDVCVFKNTGSSTKPSFTRSMGAPRYVDPRFQLDDPSVRLVQLLIGKKTLIPGNYMSPWWVDWNKDGKPDLLLGEGTYSANSIRLLLNNGSIGKPQFIEEKEFYLAYGEGFEQLVPAVVDYNGDGIDDMLVGTRTGQIRKHKGSEKAISGVDMVKSLKGTLAPPVMDFDGFLEIAGKDKFDVMSNVYPCDWNDDGLFDLLMGSTSGKIFVTLNTGTKTNPKFDRVDPIKGTNTEKDQVMPTGWGIEIGYPVGGGGSGWGCNAAYMFSSEKSLVWREGFPEVKSVAGESFMYFRYIKGYVGWAHVRNDPPGKLIKGGRGFWGADHKMVVTMVKGRKYEFSLQSILEGKPVVWRIAGGEEVEPATDDRPSRGEHREISGTIPPSGGWQKHVFTFDAPQKVQTNVTYGIGFELGEGDARFCLDDLVFKEIKR